MPKMNQNNRVKTSSDVLVAIATLETKVDMLSADVRDIKDGTKADIEFLKVDKISRAEAVRINTDQAVVNADIETRIRFIERYMWLAIGALGLIEFVLQTYSNFK